MPPGLDSRTTVERRARKSHMWSRVLAQVKFCVKGGGGEWCTESVTFSEKFFKKGEIIKNTTKIIMKKWCKNENQKLLNNFYNNIKKFSKEDYISKVCRALAPPSWTDTTLQMVSS
jgi:hypothetical protein